jgi:hypothetical protein
MAVPSESTLVNNLATLSGYTTLLGRLGGNWTNVLNVLLLSPMAIPSEATLLAALTTLESYSTLRARMGGNFTDMTTALLTSEGAGASGGGGIVGELRHFLLAAAPAGWVPLNGQLVSSLTLTQQAAWATLGIAGLNLPAIPVGAAITCGALGASLGSATITKANLPNYNLVGGNHAHSISDSGHQHSVQQANNGTFNSNGAAGAPVGFGFSFPTSAVTTGISINASGDLTISSGGSGTAFVPLSMGANTFMYLGL